MGISVVRTPDKLRKAQRRSGAQEKLAKHNIERPAKPAAIFS
jgi:hypothetical protein